MNTKTVGLASGKHSHHYLLLLLGIDAKGLLLCGRTMQVIDDELFYLLGYLLMIVHTFLRFRLSIALSTTVHFRIIPRIQ